MLSPAYSTVKNLPTSDTIPSPSQAEAIFPERPKTIGDSDGDEDPTKPSILNLAVPKLVQENLKSLIKCYDVDGLPASDLASAYKVVDNY